MENKNDDLDYNKIGQITSDFVKVSDQVKITCKKIIEKKFSKFPVIIISDTNNDLGTLLIDQNEILNNKWKYFASYAEVGYDLSLHPEGRRFEFCSPTLIIFDKWMFFVFS